MAEKDEAEGRIEEESARVEGVSPIHFKNERYTLANVYIPLFYYIARQRVWPGSKPAVVRRRRSIVECCDNSLLPSFQLSRDVVAFLCFYMIKYSRLFQLLTCI